MPDVSISKKFLQNTFTFDQVLNDQSCSGPPDPGWEPKGMKKVGSEHANWNSHIASSSILVMQTTKLHFLSPILYEGSTLINFDFLIKGNF